MGAVNLGGQTNEAPEGVVMKRLALLMLFFLSYDTFSQVIAAPILVLNHLHGLRSDEISPDTLPFFQ